MKTLILIIIALWLLVSCKKDSQNEPAKFQLGVSAYQINMDTNGRYYQSSRKISMSLWDANKVDIDTTDTYHLMFGLAYDKTSNQLVGPLEFDFGYTPQVTVEKGRYFVYIETDDTALPKAAYSFKFIDLTGAMQLKKIFSYQSYSYGYDPW